MLDAPLLAQQLPVDVGGEGRAGAPLLLENRAEKFAVGLRERGRAHGHAEEQSADGGAGGGQGTKFSHFETIWSLGPRLVSPASVEIAKRACRSDERSPDLP